MNEQHYYDSARLRVRASWRTLIAAVVLATAAACSNGTTDSNSSEERENWPEGLPFEDLPEVDCSARRCFVVEPKTTLCSVDSTQAPESNFFTTKSRITIPDGAYPLQRGDVFTDFSVKLETQVGAASMTAVGGLQYEVAKMKLDAEGGVLQSASLSSVPASAFRSAEVEFSNLLIKAPFFEDLREKDHFRFGDPENMWWWIWSDRKVVAMIEPGSSLFPNTVSRFQVWYAPCSLEGSPDDIFSFNFVNGDALDLRVRAAQTKNLTGRHIGRLLSATGTFQGRAMNTTNLDDLAFFGSTDSYELLCPRW